MLLPSFVLKVKIRYMRRIKILQNHRIMKLKAIKTIISLTFYNVQETNHFHETGQINILLETSRNGQLTTSIDWPSTVVQILPPGSFSL